MKNRKGIKMVQSVNITKVLLLIIILSIEISFAQVQRINFQRDLENARNKRETEKIIKDNSILNERINQRKNIEKGLFELDAMEDWIDPSEYIVGPGDVFSINIIGNVNQYFETIITPEGWLNIPGMCAVNVKGKTLKQVKDLVNGTMKQFFKNTDVFTNLVSVRPLKIYILGEVYEPGAYISKPTERLFDGISKSGGTKQLALIHKIEIQRGDSSILVDGYKYLINGDMTSNPYFRDGDVIYIPKAKPYEETITVQGGFLKPGIYPIREGERLSEFLFRESEFSENVELSTIAVTRNNSKGKKTVTILVDTGNSMNRLDEIVLQPRDVIELGVLTEVYVQGEVKVPGAYPFVSGFKAIDYLGLAGGNTQRGNAQSVKVLHVNNTKSKGLHTPISRGDVIVIPKSFSFGMVGQLSILQIVSSLASTLLTIFVLSGKLQ